MISSINIQLKIANYIRLTHIHILCICLLYFKNNIICLSIIKLYVKKKVPSHNYYETDKIYESSVIQPVQSL